MLERDSLICGLGIVDTFTGVGVILVIEIEQLFSSMIVLSFSPSLLKVFLFIMRCRSLFSLFSSMMSCFTFLLIRASKKKCCILRAI